MRSLKLVHPENFDELKGIRKKKFEDVFSEENMIKFLFES